MNKKRIIIIGCVLVIAAIGFLGFRMHNRKKAMEAMVESRSQIETVQVKKQNLINSISVTGTIASADAWDVSASAKNVEVLNVNYKVGDYVNAGDVVVVLDTTELELSLTEAQNKQALSAYNESKSIETASENYTEAVEDGTDAYNKAVKNEAEAKENLQEAEGDLSEAASRLKRREEKLGEAKDALEAAAQPTEPEGYASLAEDSLERQAYETALEEYRALEKAYADAQASYTEAHQEYNAAADAEEKAVDAYENAAEALSDADKNNERNISNAADSLERAQKEHEYSNDSSQQTIENYQEQIASCTVTAPISGIITEMKVDEGDTYMGEGNVLFSIADNEHFIVAANVDEYDISDIAKDMAAAVIVEAIGDEELPAKVSFVSPTAESSNTGSASYKIEIALDDVNTDLRIGMTAKASIVLESVQDALTVPYDCVETDDSGNSFIYVDKNREKIQLPVEVGMTGDYYVEVSGDDLDETTMVYYPTPMLNAEGSQSTSNEDVMIVTPMGGGGAPAGGGHGGRPAGGGHSGGQGGF